MGEPWRKSPIFWIVLSFFPLWFDSWEFEGYEEGEQSSSVTVNHKILLGSWFTTLPIKVFECVMQWLCATFSPPLNSTVHTSFYLISTLLKPNYSHCSRPVVFKVWRYTCMRGKAQSRAGLKVTVLNVNQTKEKESIHCSWLNILMEKRIGKREEKKKRVLCECFL